MKPKETLTIGIDIDGTVTDPGSIVPLMNETLGKNLTYADCTDYNLAAIYNITEEQFMSWLDQYGRRLYNEAPVHGNADHILRRWHQERQHKLVYISAREDKHLDVTLEWFNRYQIPYHEIDLIGSHDKIHAAKKWQVELFLEDRLENALQLSEELNIPVFLFDTPYNQGKLPPLVHRIHSWQEVYEAIDRIFL
jgi:uncharacterized HAD superfamily protein